MKHHDVSLFRECGTRSQAACGGPQLLSSWQRDLGELLIDSSFLVSCFLFGTTMVTISLGYLTDKLINMSKCLEQSL